MKYLTLFLLLPCLAIAQKKDNNAIIIPEINKQDVIKIFKEKGYAIKKADKRYVITVPQNALNNTIQFTMTLGEGTSYLMGVYNGDSISSTTDSSDSSTKRNNAPFLLMDSLARSFGKPVTYQTYL